MEQKIVGIISGKGGVGKTSLTASLASLAKKDPEVNAFILDCDVDAPNLALILPPENEINISTKDTYSTRKAIFHEEACTQCKKCIEEHFCEFNALKWNADKNFPSINELACEGCGACRVLCPEKAFEINVVKSGEIISYNTNLGLPLAYGKTKLGSTTSGKLVSEAKEFAKHTEGYDASNLILIDGPPGIGCPVIATVSGLDYVIAITEPTPSGLHDLIRAIDVITQFGIQFGIIINKYDIKSSFQQEFKDFIRGQHYDVLGNIPFDLSIPMAMSFAKPVIDHDPNSEASISIKNIYLELKKRLWN